MMDQILQLRVSRVNTEIVKDDQFQVGVPMWAMDEANFAVAREVYRQILDNKLPADAAEWLQCFEDAKYVHYRMKLLDLIVGYERYGWKI